MKRVSALAHAVDPDCRNNIKVDQMFTLVDEVLADGSSSETIHSFAKNLKSREDEIRKNWALNAHLDD
ncbi:hypothetical protein ACFL2V_00395 [Pseudomonadota bacterium]